MSMYTFTLVYWRTLLNALSVATLLGQPTFEAYTDAYNWLRGFR